MRYPRFDARRTPGAWALPIAIMYISDWGLGEGHAFARFLCWEVSVTWER